MLIYILLHIYTYLFICNNRLVVESKESARAGVEAEGAVLVASLNLVDLAGSESVRHTGVYSCICMYVNTMEPSYR